MKVEGVFASSMITEYLHRLTKLRGVGFGPPKLKQLVGYDTVPKVGESVATFSGQYPLRLTAWLAVKASEFLPVWR